MASLSEITEAVNAARAAGCQALLLLHCVSGYPTPPEDMRLATLAHLQETFEVPVGLSDHSEGIAVSLAAVALGACALERHVTLRRSDGGVDSAFSLEPEELAALASGARDAWAAIGKIGYEPAPSERSSLAYRRSLYIVADVAVGEPLTAANVRSIRPNGGLAPRFLDELLGRRAVRPLHRGEPVEWSMVESPSA
jgi:N-acetylneuraminate synthase